ncbi:transposable element Tcb2 transposase [Trichonephila clavipes]|nr:transposable element Tcb2 transposase [Trichonephila clavipes]
MDDNSRPHSANLVEDFLLEEGIVRMEWLACYPDMDPIEHVWDALGRRVAGRQPPPQTLQELERALLEEWDRIPQLVINSIIESMPQRTILLERRQTKSVRRRDDCPAFCDLIARGQSLAESGRGNGLGRSENKRPETRRS